MILPTLEAWKASTSFFRINGLNDLFFIEVGGQRQLHENAVDLLLLIEGYVLGEQLRLVVSLGRGVFLRIDTHLGAGLLLVVDIDAGGRVVSHNDHCEAGRNSLFLQRSHLFLDLSAHLRGGGFCRRSTESY